MLKKIVVENFKGVEGRVEVDLKPITLLFGPNSAGKSTILHAIHYAHAVLKTGDHNMQHSLLAGNLELGGFNRVINQGALGRADDAAQAASFGSAMMRTKATAQTDLTLGFQWQPDPETALRGVENIIERNINSARLDLRISTGIEPCLELSFSIEGTAFAYVSLWPEMAEDGQSMEVLRCSIMPNEPVHPIFQEEPLVDLQHEEKGRLDSLKLRCALAAPQLELPPWLSQVKANALSSHLAPQNAFNTLLEVLPSAGEFVSLLTFSLFQSLIDELEKVRYLGANRPAPPSHYERRPVPREADWTNGRAAWELLERLIVGTRKTDEPALHTRSPILGELNRWLSDEARLRTGYEVTAKLVDAKRHQLLEKLTQMRDAGVMGMSPSLREAYIDERGHSGPIISLQTTDTGFQIAPHEAGTGVAAVMPVVLAALSRTVLRPGGKKTTAELVCIEEPESHTHPRMQAVLADLFLATCAPDHLFLIETHSEHLMLRLLRRIRETTDDELGPDDPSATVDQVSVITVQKRDGAVQLTPVRISDDGDFRDPWPDGFFDERMDEL
jgi:predicted ATPase